MLAICFAVSPSVWAEKDWNWRPLLSAPRIGGRLWTVTIDPKDPARIFIGTEEGTLVRSVDGGNTWTEQELGPVVTEATKLAFAPPELPVVDPESILWVDPPDREYADFPRYSEFDPLAGTVIPPNFYLQNIKPSVQDPDTSLLDDLMATPSVSPNPVVRVALCERFPWPLLVATQSELFGSEDDGLTFIRLFAVTSDQAITDVACSPKERGVVALTTDSGMFVSSNGGATFDPASGIWPGDAAGAVAYSPDGLLYASEEDTLFAGESLRTLEEVFPAGSGSDTAPWLDIHFIEPRGGEVWIATEGGLRHRSRDGQWSRVPSLEGEATTQVRVGTTRTGKPRVAAMTRSFVFASDDGGQSWSPFFHGFTPRTFRDLSFTPPAQGRASSWYVLTSSELWTTAPLPDRPLRGPDPAAFRRWALERLDAAESSEAVVESVLEASALSNEAIGRLYDRADYRNFLPYVDARFDVLSTGESGETRTSGAVNRVLTSASDDKNITFYAYLTWWWDPPADTDSRESLHALQKRIGFAVRDAWRERLDVLTDLASGRGSPVELRIMQERVLALEGLIDQFRHIRAKGTEP